LILINILFVLKMPFGAYENSKTDEIKRNFYPVKGTNRKENTPEFRRVLEDYTARSINELTVTKDSLIVVEVVKNDHLIGRIALTSLKGSVPLRCLSKPLEENKNSEEENIDSRDSRTFVQDPKFWPDEDDFDSDLSFPTEENTEEVVKDEEIQIGQNRQQISRNTNLTHQKIARIITNCSSAKEGAFIKWTKGEYVTVIETEFVLPHFYKVRRRSSVFDEGQILKRNVVILQELSEQSYVCIVLL
ncbi:Tyrosine-protein kinase transforming protein Abl, partial [Armadillidium nasatum]